MAPGAVPPPSAQPWAPTGGAAPVGVTSDPRASIGIALVVVGLLLAVAPLLSWYKVSFGGNEASVNGWGMESASGGFGSDSSSSDSSDEIGWMLGPIPDGVVVSILGVGVAGVGLALRKQGATVRPYAGLPSAGAGNLPVMALVTGAAGAVFVGYSWYRMKAEWDRQLGKSVDDEPFAALLLGAVHFDPGAGLILSGIGFVVIGVLGAVVLARTK